MEQNNSIIELWPVSLLVKSLEGHEAINVELLKMLDEYRTAHPAKHDHSYVSPDNFSNDVENPALDVIKKFIMDGIYEIALKKNEQFWRQHKLQNIDIDLTGLWFQVSNHHAFHETHVHGNCSWSGVYYVQAGSASSDRNDVQDNGMINGVTRFYGPYLDYSAAGHGDWGNYYLHHYSHTVYPEDGMLVIFPSYLKHMALPYNGEEDRVILSFHAQVNSNTPIEFNYSFN